MPCDSITTTTLSKKLAKATPEILKTALENAGWRSIRTYNDGTIRASKAGYDFTWVPGRGMKIESGTSRARNEKQFGEIVRAYSGAAVTWAASRAGWNVKKTAENKYVATRR